MNKWMKRVVSIAFVITQFLVIPTVSASSLESIRSEKKSIEVEVNKTQKELNEKLSEASELSTNLEKLNQEIIEHEETIAQTTEEIEVQEEVVEKRYEYTADQLKALQTSEVNQNIILNLFQAENVSEFFNTLYTASVLTEASENQLLDAKNEQDKLDELKEELAQHQEELDEKQTQTIEQKESLDTKLADLKSTLAANQDKLEQLSAKEADLKKPAVTTASSNSKKETSSKSENKASKKSSNKETTASTDSAGSWMTFESTGYSMNEPGLNHQTATGVDLRQNPRVVAVDPSQIPLGSLVEVEGMGVYLAADTGGAIKGRIIDVHFNSISEMNRWGRRNVRIRVLD